MYRMGLNSDISFTSFLCYLRGGNTPPIQLWGLARIVIAHLSLVPVHHLIDKEQNGKENHEGDHLDQPLSLSLSTISIVGGCDRIHPLYGYTPIIRKYE